MKHPDYADYAEKARELAERFEQMYTRLCPSPREAVRKELYDLFVEIDHAIWEHVGETLAPSTGIELKCSHTGKPTHKDKGGNERCECGHIVRLANEVPDAQLMDETYEQYRKRVGEIS